MQQTASALSWRGYKGERRSFSGKNGFPLEFYTLTSGLPVVYDKAPACGDAGGSFIIFNYSTVTDFARLRGLSTSQPRAMLA